MTANLLTVVVARHDSDRLPGKVLADVAGRPLLAWVLERVTHPTTGLGGLCVVATTDRACDDPIAQVGTACGVDVYRHPGDPDDVVGRIDAVVRARPRAEWIMPHLADCPFLATELVRPVLHNMDRVGADVIYWYLKPRTWPVYGAREFPMSRRAWTVLAASARGVEREHVRMWLDNNRGSLPLKEIYHQAPDREYFHAHEFRLEVDVERDLELVRLVGEKGPGMLAPLIKKDGILSWLRRNGHHHLNRDVAEKTGPYVSFDEATHGRWFNAMRLAPFVTWQREVFSPWEVVDGLGGRDKRVSPIFCSDDTCHVGYGFLGHLYTLDGSIINGAPMLACPCGAGLVWSRAVKSDRRGGRL